MEVSVPALTSSLVNELAQQAGFSLAGIAPVPPLDSPTTREERERFDEWIAAGAAGEMEYLKRRNDGGELVRSTLHAVFPWVKSVVVCAANYNTDQPRSIDPAPEGSGWISRYAWSEDHTVSPPRPSDYHKVLLKRLRSLEAALHDHAGQFESRCYVDTGPLVERVYARYAGIGWTAKNCTILNQRIGSLFFLSVILTSLEPESVLPQLAADRCGSCTRCIDACPTDALTPYQMDATRCISYLTIEKRGPIPEDLRAGTGRQIFGCDICQDVCPWNQKSLRVAPPAEDPELAARAALVNPALDWLASMTPDDFAQWFYGSPIKRAKYEGLRRNLAIAMGNSGRADHLPRLEEWSRDDDPVLRETAEWAIRQIGKE
ncbi:MAG TPA: tRNA epoxyqueuosine(34) reductase QueG [Acidobacteriaceae bacterium]|nr:tRNA epoxyqueuosine(34) reductase QueG [Acidobacteriaceae bacterium]